MNTQARIAALCHAAQGFASLGSTTSADLTGLVAAELGDARALDEFVPLGGSLAKAVAPRVILHVVSGNTSGGTSSVGLSRSRTSRETMRLMTSR